MKLPELLLALTFALCILFAYKLDKLDKQIKHDVDYLEDLEMKIIEQRIVLDSLQKKEAIIIEKHEHLTNKFYENHYTILTANDSTTKNNLFSNLQRYEYLHLSTPSKDNQSNR